MIDKFIKKLKSLYETKNYLILSGYSILLLLVLVCSIMITYFICVNVFNFIAQRFEAVTAIAGAYLMIYFLWKDKQNKQQQQAQAALLEKTVAQQSADKALAESHYSTTRQCLFSTLSENAGILNLQKPDRLSELDSPSKTVLKGNVYMCQYVVVKNGECNPDKIKELLQMRIAQKLSAHEFAGITQTTYIHNGMAYPLLCIDEIRDNGSFLQIDVAWASESYCNLLDSRAQAKLENLKPPSISYHDGDF